MFGFLLQLILFDLLVKVKPCWPVESIIDQPFDLILGFDCTARNFCIITSVSKHSRLEFYGAMSGLFYPITTVCFMNYLICNTSFISSLLLHLKFQRYEEFPKTLLNLTSCFDNWFVLKSWNSWAVHDMAWQIVKNATKTDCKNGISCLLPIFCWRASQRQSPILNFHGFWNLLARWQSPVNPLPQNVSHRIIENQNKNFVNHEYFAGLMSRICQLIFTVGQQRKSADT